MLGDGLKFCYLEQKHVIKLKVYTFALLEIEGQHLQN